MRKISVSAFLAAALVLTGCDGASSTSQTTAVDAPRIASADIAPSVPEKPAVPDHNYAMVEDGEYGYQPGISDDERARGVAAKALVIIRYRGVQKGAYVVEMPDDSGALLRMECKDPCQYIKTKVLLSGEVLRTETVPNASGSLMAAVFEDALNGQLKPYGKRGG